MNTVGAADKYISGFPSNFSAFLRENVVGNEIKKKKSKEPLNIYLWSYYPNLFFVICSANKFKYKGPL